MWRMFRRKSIERQLQNTYTRVGWHCQTTLIRCWGSKVVFAAVGIGFSVLMIQKTSLCWLKAWPLRCFVAAGPFKWPNGLTKHETMLVKDRRPYLHPKWKQTAPRLANVYSLEYPRPLRRFLLDLPDYSGSFWTRLWLLFVNIQLAKFKQRLIRLQTT